MPVTVVLGKWSWWLAKGNGSEDRKKQTDSGLQERVSRTWSLTRRRVWRERNQGTLRPSWSIRRWYSGPISGSSLANTQARAEGKPPGLTGRRRRDEWFLIYMQPKDCLPAEHMTHMRPLGTPETLAVGEASSKAWNSGTERWKKNQGKWIFMSLWLYL